MYANLTRLIYPSPLSNRKFLFYVCGSISVLEISSFVSLAFFTRHRIESFPNPRVGAGMTPCIDQERKVQSQAWSPGRLVSQAALCGTLCGSDATDAVSLRARRCYRMRKGVGVA